MEEYIWDLAEIELYAKYSSELNSPLKIWKGSLEKILNQTWSIEIPKEIGTYFRLYMLNNKLQLEIVRVNELGLLAPDVMLNNDRTKPIVYFSNKI